MAEGLEMVASVSGGGGEDGEDGGEETGYGLVAATERVAVEEKGEGGGKGVSCLIHPVVAPYIYDATYYNTPIHRSQLSRNLQSRISLVRPSSRIAS